MSRAFREDPRLQQVAEAYSLDAVDFAKSSFGIALDWSDSSVRHIETVLAHLHQDVPKARPSEEQVHGFAKTLGSYVGEVHRRNHGGCWGIVTLNGDSFPGMRAPSGRLFWPWGRAQNRIVDGAQNNMWHYYQVLVDESELRASSASPEPQGTPWWKGLFRL